MAFAQSELSLMAYTGTQGGNHFYFYLNSAGDTVTTAGFFDDVADSVSQGDLLYDVDGGGLFRLTESEGEVTATAITTTPA
ncbi:MAG: hypothetical protein K0U78_13545 [Actinomycetia bacterium]|nr:hypothetical protein [Actinomycetes bacterium]